MKEYILGIESSCDDTSAAVINNHKLCSNIISTQVIHEKYGGVVPELASREHQKNIIPVVKGALHEANISLEDISAIAFTKGPGLLGSLMVGVSFAKSLSISTGKPLIGVNHLHGHLLAHTIADIGEEDVPQQDFPFLSLLISGGHTMIVKVTDYLKYEIIGQTIDDAAGEAFDKCGKVLGFNYPAGPIIDELSKKGNPNAFTFGKPQIKDLDFSFSGLKTSFLYSVRDNIKNNSSFIEEQKYNLAASLQKTIIDILLDKLKEAVKKTQIPRLVITGGVAANDGLRSALIDYAEKYKWQVTLPKKKFTSDNAAMIAKVGWHKYKNNMFDDLSITPKAKIDFFDV